MINFRLVGNTTLIIIYYFIREKKIVDVFRLDSPITYGGFWNDKGFGHVYPTGSNRVLAGPCFWEQLTWSKSALTATSDDV